MVSNTHIHEHLERVIQSKLFRQSQTNQKLLTYLVEESLKGNIPREMDIAIDFFGKDASYNPADDSLVRSHLYTLRQKLEKYNLTEGKNDELRFVIPKGRYEVVCVETPTPTQSPHIKRKVVYWCIGAIFGLVLFIAGHLIHDASLDQRSAKLAAIDKNHPIWADFIKSDKPLLIVLGDYFIFWERQKFTSGDRKIRDGAINSVEDLETFKQENPERGKLITDNTGSYLSPDLVFGLSDILPFFSLHHKTYALSTASLLSEQDLREYNTIFIGPYKTLRLYDTFVSNLRLRYQIYPHKIIADEENLDYMLVNLPDESQFRKDYALVAQVPGPNNTIHMLISFFAPGRTRRIIQPLLETKYADKIASQFLKPNEEFPTYFEALYEITDLQGNISAEITHFYEIDRNAFQLDSVLTVNP